MTRVLHLPTCTGGMAWALAQGEKSLGLESLVLYTESNWLDYPSDLNLHLEGANPLRKFVERVLAFVSVRQGYDIFHFNGGSSLLNTGKAGFPHVDLPLYPEKAKLFVSYNGCDARQKYPTLARKKVAACHDPQCYDGMCLSGRLDGIRRRNIAKMAKHVQHMWAVNPDLLSFLPREKSSFLPYAVRMGEGPVVKPDFQSQTLKIAHAPTNRAAKGSETILDALERVKHQYRKKIEICLIENVPNAKALERYREADIVVDQIRTGWYGGFAVEAMSMGKPVICRIEKEDLQFVPKKMAHDLADAVIDADQDNLVEVLLRCVEDRGFVREKALAGIEYSRTWHDPKFVASITKHAYENSLAR